MMVKVIGTKHRWDGKLVITDEGLPMPEQFICELRVEASGKPVSFVGKSDKTAAEAYTDAKLQLAEYVVQNAR